MNLLYNSRSHFLASTGRDQPFRSKFGPLTATFRQFLIVIPGDYPGASHDGPTDNGEAAALGDVGTEAATETIDLGVRTSLITWRAMSLW